MCAIGSCVAWQQTVKRRVGEVCGRASGQERVLWVLAVLVARLIQGEELHRPSGMTRQGVRGLPLGR